MLCFLYCSRCSSFNDFHSSSLSIVVFTRTVDCNKFFKIFQVIEEGLDKYPADTIFVSFNGGKDCTALLHLVSAVWQRKSVSKPIQAIYFRTLDPFPEVEAFIQDAIKRLFSHYYVFYLYNLTVTKSFIIIMLYEWFVI